MTTGANEDDHHLRGVSIERDIKTTAWTDIRGVSEGDACPLCDGVLKVAKAIEVGHIFKLGTKYSDSMGARVLTAEGKEVPLVMGFYGIGVERILAAAIELHHDEAGIIFPMTIAPFEVLISPLNMKDESVRAAAEKLYDELSRARVDVLYDDRDERAGVKLNDADLIGIPLRITIGPKKLKDGLVELYDRAARKSDDVQLANVSEVAAATVARGRDGVRA